VTLVSRTVEKKERRARREAELGERQRALPDKRYGVILADPPWRFEPYSRITGMDRAADNHYPTNALEEIKALTVAAIAARDCALFLWATVPMLPQAHEVMASWGFTYKSNFVWAKDRIGTGYWGRNKHEHLLIGTRGHVPAPAMGTQAASLIEAPVGRYSEKPAVLYGIIDRDFPTLPKIELRARDPSGRELADDPLPGSLSWAVPSGGGFPTSLRRDYLLVDAGEDAASAYVCEVVFCAKSRRREGVGGEGGVARSRASPPTKACRPRAVPLARRLPVHFGLVLRPKDLTSGLGQSTADEAKVDRGAEPLQATCLAEGP
jgi:N6-adenosine-specific RNA methylase IME4